MNKPRIGIVCDGPGDFASMRRKFRHANVKILQTSGPRGHLPTPEMIANTTSKDVKILFAFDCTLVIVICDYEQRSMTYTEFCNRLSGALAQRWGNRVRASVPNIMIENWYLADIRRLSTKKRYLRTIKTQKSFEGKHGKNELRKLFVPRISYSETKHGPELFELLSDTNARKWSRSFDDFIACIETHRETR